ncbi:MAG: hypothetical protein JRF33_27020, partial [Deltaproteobacteria bacterium]|nr:hypothetical protein [Deltaproteobacteria bacterium]
MQSHLRSLLAVFCILALPTSALAQNAATPTVDSNIYTSPAGNDPASALDGPTQEGEVSIVREQYFDLTAPDMTGSGVSLGVTIQDDGFYSQSIYVRTGPVIDSSRSPESEGSITFPAGVTVIGTVEADAELDATDATWGLPTSIDYGSSARGMEAGEGPITVVNGDGSTTVSWITDMNSTPYTDDFRILLDFGNFFPPSLDMDIVLTTGDDINVGASDGGGVTSITATLTGDLDCLADTDGDGIDDCTEAANDPDTDDDQGGPDVADDFDDDGIPSYLDPDSDGDGVDDGDDADPFDAQTCEDSDSDGCDDCSAGAGPDPANDGTDTDADGICDAGDNCVTDVNAGQEDLENDGIGDVCDNCVNDINPGQEDLDSD